MLTDLQIQEKKDYIEQYISAKNSADGSKHDANANVTNKNIATLSAELFKDYTRQLKISLIQDRIRARFDDDLAKEFKRQLDAGEVYLNDSTGLSIYCNAISLYPFLLNGLKDLGGECDAPKHLSSFCGGYVNLVYAISAQQSGALASVGFLMCFDYFARKDYGDNYLETAKDKITAELQGVVYSINQPAGSRGYQSNFLNWTIFDKYYFNALYENFVFPDMTKPDYESVNKLQKFFMKWFNKERTKHILTFPVITASVLNDGEKLLDKDFQDFIAEELAEGNSFFIYNDTNASSLSSCCFDGSEIISYTKDNKTYNKEIKDFVEEFVNLCGKNEGKIDSDIFINSYNPETLEIEKTKVTGFLKKFNEYNQIITLETKYNIIKITQDHIILVKNKSTNLIQELESLELLNKEKDYLVYVDCDDYKGWTDIENCEVEEHSDYVYDIELEKNHYFSANNIITHNCRLRNSIENQINEFSFTLGAGGEMTGSKNVMTINLNRLIQDKRDLRTEVDKVHKYQVSVNDYFIDLYNKDMLPVFKAGYNSLDKQFLTIGINGIVEGAEYLGYTISNNPEYMKFISDTLKEISDINKENSKKYNVKFNTEFIPGENVAVVFAKKDKADGYKVTRDCYSSYIYAPEDENISILDKFEMMGGKSTEYLDGGSAYHCNLDDYPSKEQFIKLLEISSKTKCKYFCFNIKITICNDCGNIDKHTLTSCPKCGSKNIDYGTRIIGYLKRISNFSTPRQKEHALRYYSKEK